MGLRILFVDDDRGTRSALTELLTEEGHFVDACKDGAQALVLLRAASYDVLLTDFIMPGMNGLELVNAAKALREPLRCIVMTGQKRVLGAPPHLTWLEKPIDFEQLLTQLAA